MPPLPLDERIVVVQCPKSSALDVASQQSHSASVRSNSTSFKPQSQHRHTRPHISSSSPSSSTSSSSSSEHRRRSPRPQKVKGGRAEGGHRAQHSDGVLVLGTRQRKPTHTIDIKLSLAAGTGEASSISRKDKGGSVRRSGSLKGNKEKKVSLHLDLGQGEKKGETIGKTGGAVQQLQNHSQTKKKPQPSTHHRSQLTPGVGNRLYSKFTKDLEQDPAPQTHPETASFSSRILQEVPSAGNKENSKLGPIHQSFNPCCQPQPHNSVPVPHASVLNTRYSALALASHSTAPLHHQFSQPRPSRTRERPSPHLHAISKSCSSSRGGGFPGPALTCSLDPSQPFSCGCCKLVRSGPGGGWSSGCQGGGGVVGGCRGSRVMGLKSLGGCLSTSSTTNTSSSNSTVSDCHIRPLRHLGCVSCSGRGGSFQSSTAFRKKLVGGCLPCAPLSTSAPLRVLQNCVGGCNPKSSQTGSSTCSYCSSDPIVVSYNPLRGKFGGLGRGGGVRTAGSFSADDDDYSVRTIWPEELAKKMTRSKDQQNHHAAEMAGDPCDSQKQDGSGGTSPVVLDCRNLLEFTRSHLTDHAGRRCLQQGKMAVLDFIGSRDSKDVGRDSLKRLWTKEGETESGFVPENTLTQPLPPCPPTACSPPSISPPHSAHTSLTKSGHREGTHPAPHTLPMAQPLQLVLKSLNRDQDDENRKVHESSPPLSLPLSSFLPASLSAEESEMTPDVENAPLSPILPCLFLGNERDAQDLDLLLQLNIGFVVNVTTHLPLYHRDSGLIHYKRLPATDSSKQNLRQYFEEVFEFIEEAHQSGRAVLVHCQAGVSRSATVVIAYLMKHTLMTMTDAYKYVKSRRPVVSPNLNFMGQLLEFERDLNSGITPRILTPKLSGLETQV
ncbi:uncharacterized protein [Paramormyrops kingsleyae]|uniref:protein-tyrosine-phosphatase n=1 Tax=Paramormyrops kingsleyae TaxID=1676925 RepID=A0A3B3QY63_9TELE|nr:uncharacterized protein LOC111834648 [Paramormyrops kingsleyae]